MLLFKPQKHLQHSHIYRILSFDLKKKQKTYLHLIFVQQMGHPTLIFSNFKAHTRRRWHRWSRKLQWWLAKIDTVNESFVHFISLYFFLFSFKVSFLLHQIFSCPPDILFIFYLWEMSFNYAMTRVRFKLGVKTLLRAMAIYCRFFVPLLFLSFRIACFHATRKRDNIINERYSIIFV